MRFGPRSLNLGNPVNRAHPLAYGLVACWVGLPHNSGGATMFDAVGGNHCDITAGTPWGVDRNLFGVLTYNGSSQSATAAYSAGLSPASITISCAIRTTASGGTFSFIDRDDFSGNRAWQFRLTGLGVLDFIPFIGGTPSTTNIGATAVNTDAWVLVAATYRASDGAVALYVNGRPDYSATITAGGLSQPTGIGVRFARSFGGGQWFPGSIGLGAIHDRALSGSENAALYAEWATGFPTLFNRRSSATWLVGAGGGGGGNRRRRFLICAGG